MNEMERIEHHDNELGVSEDHPYWRDTPQDRERRLAIVEGLIELARVVLGDYKVNRRMGRSKKV
jgi:hypothetical protein